MSITGANETKLIWVEAFFLFHFQALKQSISDIASLRLRKTLSGNLKRHDFKICPFIVSGKRWMGIRSAFDLSNLNNRLISHSKICILRSKRITKRIFECKHKTIRSIRVMRYGHALDAVFSYSIHPLPQTFRII